LYITPNVTFTADTTTFLPSSEQAVREFEEITGRKLCGKKNGRPEWTRTIDLLRVREAL
jgi:hypothetical protein